MRRRERAAEAAAKHGLRPWEAIGEPRRGTDHGIHGIHGKNFYIDKMQTRRIRFQFLYLFSGAYFAGSPTVCDSLAQREAVDCFGAAEAGTLLGAVVDLALGGDIHKAFAVRSADNGLIGG